jgi:hypothetical protein
MNRLLTYALGPEAYWLLVCLAAKVLALRNKPPTEAGNEFLGQFGWTVPLVFVPLVFLCFLVPGPGRWWLLLRLDLASLVGMVAAVTILLEAVKYNDSRDSGTGSGYIAFLSLGLVGLAAGTVIAALTIWWKSRGPH